MKANSTQHQSTILLVDDDPIVLETFGESLRAAGFNVITAMDGSAALQLCLTKPPDLAVIDYLMPGLSGLDLARQLVSQSDVAFMFLSAYAESAVVEAAVAAGAMTYVIKPQEGSSIIPTVRAALLRAREFGALRSETDRLSAALKMDRSIGAATGLIMAKYQLQQQDAFESLRRYARARRERLETVAVELLMVTQKAEELYEAINSQYIKPGQEPASKR